MNDGLNLTEIEIIRMEKITKYSIDSSTYEAIVVRESVGKQIIGIG